MISEDSQNYFFNSRSKSFRDTCIRRFSWITGDFVKYDLHWLQFLLNLGATFLRYLLERHWEPQSSVDLVSQLKNCYLESDLVLKFIVLVWLGWKESFSLCSWGAKSHDLCRLLPVLCCIHSAYSGDAYCQVHYNKSFLPGLILQIDTFAGCWSFLFFSLLAT